MKIFSLNIFIKITSNFYLNILFIALLEFLTQSEAQTLYATMNYEYPVNPSVSPSEELNSWGEFKEDKLPVERLAELAPTAQKIIDRVGW